jgi:hypothetical protein
MSNAWQAHPDAPSIAALTHGPRMAARRAGGRLRHIHTTRFGSDAGGLDKPDGGATWLTLYHAQFFDLTAPDNHERGWTQFIVRLESLYE